MDDQPTWGQSLRDKVSGEVGKFERAVGGDYRIWLFESDTVVWRKPEQVERITPLEYDQACFEWELREEPTVTEAFEQRGEPDPKDFDPQM